MIASMDPDKVLAVFRALETHQVDYIVVGAVAINLLGLPRGTKDLDLFIRPTHDNVDRLRRALRSVWDDPELDALSADDLAGDYPAVQYGPPDDSFRLDIMARLGEAFAYEDLEAEERIVDGVRVRVATPATLYRMKRGTVRLQDRADAARLREHFGLDRD
jgi:hypothetical protein